MTQNISTRPNRLTIKWTEEDGESFFAESGKDRLEVFAAPFKPGRFCWRHLRMSSGLFWKPKNGGISDSIEAAMTAAGTALAGGPKEWEGATRVTVR
jgi:hypothetical protein